MRSRIARSLQVAETVEETGLPVDAVRAAQAWLAHQDPRDALLRVTALVMAAGLMPGITIEMKEAA